MKTSLQGILAIIAEEAIVLSTYKDKKGVPTIGIGHTAAAGPPVPMPGAKITIERAISIFAADLGRFERHVAGAIKRPLKQHEFDALVSFDFNTGAIESGTVDDKLNAGGIAAAMATLQQYEKSGGQYVKGLDLRRDREEAMFTRGIYPKVPHFKVYDRYPGTVREVPPRRRRQSCSRMIRASRICQRLRPRHHRPRWPSSSARCCWRPSAA